jgi:drug/metabolite transporter (DMT)-like permease
VAQRIAGELGSVYYFNGIRYLLAGLVVLPFAWYTNRRLRDKTSDEPHSNLTHDQYKWMAIAGFLLFVAAAFQQAGMQYTTAGNAGFITSLYVVIVPFIVYIGWREKPHWLSVIAVGMAAVGAYLLSTGGSFEVQRGDALELVGAFFWAMHVVVLGKFASRFEPMSFSVGQLLICGFLNLGVGVLIEEPVFTWALAGAAIYTAIFSLGLCYTLQVWAQRYTPPSDAALILSLESVFAVLAGLLLLDERLMRVQVAGCVLIFAAVCLSQANSWNLWGTIDRNHLVEGR